jgi:predicted PurR-regulated permease PerM
MKEQNQEQIEIIQKNILEQQQKNFKKRFYLITGLLFAGFLFLVRDILMPFVLSAFFAYLLSPMIGFFESKGIKKIISIVFLYLIFLTIFIGTIIVFVPKIYSEITSLSQKIPEYIFFTKKSLFTLQTNLEYKYPIIKQQKIFDKIVINLQQFLESFVSKIPSLLSSIFSIISLFVLIPVITFFFLLAGKDFMNKILNFLPSRYTETTLSIICELDEILGNFLRGQFLESVVVGLLSIVGLLILKIDYAIIIGTIAGLANMIPYLGPFAGSIPAIIVAVVKFGSFEIVLKVMIMFALIQFIDNNFVQPLILSKGVKLHPVTIMFALLAGAQIAGVIGMFFAVPVAGMVKTTFLIIAKRKNLI